MKSEKATLPPIFVVGDHEKHTLELSFDRFDGEKAGFLSKNGEFRGVSSVTSKGRKWGQLGEKIDLPIIDPETGF